MMLSIAAMLGMLLAGTPQRGRRTHELHRLCSASCSAALVGLGLYGLVTNPDPLRKILAFNLFGSGVFLIFGVVARRGAAAGLGGDPVLQALTITGLVVAFAATALAVALLLRLFEATGSRNARVGIAPPTPTRATPDPASRWRPRHLRSFLLPLALDGAARRHARSHSRSAAGMRTASRFAAVPVGLALAVAIVIHLARSGEALEYLLGAWAPPLGVRLRADGLAAAMMLVTAVIIGATALFAGPEFGAGRERPKRRAAFAFWQLLLAIWGALNTVLLAHDLFTLFVALELLTFAARAARLPGRARRNAAGGAALSALRARRLGALSRRRSAPLRHATAPSTSRCSRRACTSTRRRSPPPR